MNQKDSRALDSSICKFHSEPKATMEKDGMMLKLSGALKY